MRDRIIVETRVVRLVEGITQGRLPACLPLDAGDVTHKMLVLASSSLTGG